MTAVFADTFYWVALTNTQDAQHHRARNFSGSLVEVMIVTTQHVLTEYLNYFAGWGPHFRRKASINVEDILSSRSVRVLPLSDELFTAGFKLYYERPDKGYSLTDCISMTAMRQDGIDEVLTNDAHFVQEGFRALYLR